MDVVRIPEWVEAYPWLGHGFSTRRGGVSNVYGAGELNLGYTADDDSAAVAENRGRVRDAVGGGELCTVRQVHGTEVVRVEHPGPSGDADGMVTSLFGVLLAVITADCVPVLLADTKNRVVGAFHAGWRGTLGRIVERGIEAMGREFGTKPEDLVAAIGPGIGPCCYVVGEEVREAFRAEFSFADTVIVEDSLNLPEANRRLFASAGVSRVSLAAECTMCSREGGVRRYFSHRGDQGRTGRMMGLIGVR